MAAGGQQWVNRVWYGNSWGFLPLLPLSWLYAAINALRRFLYRKGILRSTRVGVPVIVVGNITVGGTGKTPVTIWLANALSKRGFKPGVASRGYRGTIGRLPLPVMPNSDPAVVGEEPVLIAKRCHCPVAVHPDRIAAARLLEEQGVDVIVADDGLQHYRLERDYEVAVVDGVRVFGNGRLLPAGPLREPVSRLRSVDRIAINRGGGVDRLSGLPADVTIETFRLRAAVARRLDESETRPLQEMLGTRVHAVAAIGNPQRFFDTVTEFGIDVTPHPLPDHAAIDSADLSFDDDELIVMTEKDAVKCRHLDSDKLWYIPVEVEMTDNAWLDRIETIIRGQSDTDNG